MELQIKGSHLAQKNVEFFNTPDKKFLIHSGGSRSGKTWSIVQAIIIQCLQVPGKTYTIVRKSFPSLRGTAYRDFIDVLTQLNIYDEANHNKSEHTYTLNKNLIEFISVDQPQKIRGRRRDVLWANECNEITIEDFRQLEIRTSWKIILDYNPSDMFGWHYDLPEQRPEQCVCYQSSYKDNPFLPKEIIQSIESYRDSDPDFWKVFGLGERATSTDLIFPQHFEQPFPNTDQFNYGLDFGYQHPTSLVQTYENENSAYIKELIYQSHLTTADLIELMNTLQIDKRKMIYADSARPEIIDEIKRAGYKIQSADKEVKAGIDYLKSHKLFIDPSSFNLKRELSSYRWKKDKQGNPTDEPVKILDDAIDSMRYSLYSTRRKTNGFSKTYGFGGF